MVKDTVTLLHKELQDNSKFILIEGANATMLDIDFGKAINMESECANNRNVTG